MTTVSQIVQRVTNRARNRRRESLLTLGAAISTTNATSFTLSATAPTGLVEGMQVEIDDELMHVTGVSGTTVNVIRGMYGSTAATHVNGSIVRIEPKYPRFEIMELMKEEIRSWHPQIFAVHEQELIFEPGVATIDSGCPAGADVIKILQARVAPLDDESWRHVRVHLIQDPDGATFTSGYGIGLQRQAFGIERTIHVAYARSFDLDTWEGSTDLQSTVLIPASAEDLLIVGTMWRMKLDDELSRTETNSQGQPRTAQEVPPTHSMQAAEALEKLRMRLLAREGRRLNAMYPIRYS